MIVERINRERLVLLGWSRAILLQLAHPLVAAGVLEHSSFRGGARDAAARLHHTVSAMLSLVFGNDTERAVTLERIRGIHRRVNGRLTEPVGIFPAGTPYSAEDSALLLWVHATLMESSAAIYTLLVQPLTSDELDLLCVESAPLIDELGGDGSATPKTWAELQHYLGGMYGNGMLAVSPQARALGHAVLSPRAAGMPLPFGPLHRLVAAGLLPPTVREAYGLRWDARRERRFSRAVDALRTTRRWAPRRLAHCRVARAATPRHYSARNPDHQPLIR